MISYSEANYVRNFSKEITEKTKDLPLYQGGPAVDYTEASHAYALNATLLHDPQRERDEILADGPSEAAQILLVERASGHGVAGSFSGVSGYIDTLQDPNADEENNDVPFDPIAHTLREEFETECGFTEDTFNLVDFYAGRATVENRTFRPGAKISIVPILGLCAARPDIYVNRAELASYRWMELEALKHSRDLSRGYRSTTLPAALGAIGLRGANQRRLLG
ncbi:MAG TPA: hypothetical protein VK502_03725 [Candidatus Saccharimonadales bacterium]|nr:hypothetical protein [Candidatus Saccharimonadales bacterium]